MHGQFPRQSEYFRHAREPGSNFRAVVLAPRKGDWARGIVDLIRFLTASAANDLLHDTLQIPDDPSAVSVLFEIATYFPWLVQPYVGTIDDPLIEQAMLPGGPDEWACYFVRRFRDSEDPVFLQALVRMRTEASRRELEALRETAPSRMWPALDASIENCGVFRDTGSESYYPKRVRIECGGLKSHDFGLLRA